MYDDGAGSNNGFNPATGTYTIPSAGLYHVDYSVEINSSGCGGFSNAAFPRALVNSVTKACIVRKPDVVNNYGETLSFPIDLKLAAGDVISIELNFVAPTGGPYTAGGNTNSSHPTSFSGHQIY